MKKCLLMYHRLTESAQFEQPFCNSTADKETQSPCCDYNSPAEFYVFVGVMAFLYSLAAIVLYVVFDDLYRNDENIPTAVSSFRLLFRQPKWQLFPTDK